jgi:hypothetical protein
MIGKTGQPGSGKRRLTVQLTRPAAPSRCWSDRVPTAVSTLPAYKGGLSGPLTPLIARQQLLLAEQTIVLLESEQADISIRLIEALGGGYSDSR